MYLSRVLVRIAGRLPPNKRAEPKKEDARKHPHTKCMRFSDEQVLNALRRIRDGESIPSVARSIDANEQTLKQWWRGLMRGHLLDQVMSEKAA
jgi:transposase-like protein